MSRDAKNSIQLWVGAVAFMGLFWAFVHLAAGYNIPQRWVLLMGAMVIGAYAAKFVWGHLRKRRAGVR